MNNKFIECCKKWVSTGDWRDFYWIFYTSDGLSFDYVNDICTKLGRAYPTWLTISTKNILFRLHSVITDYENGGSSCTISSKYRFPRTTLQSILSGLGVLRSKSEAQSNAIKLGRTSINLGGIFFKYKLDDKTLDLKSTYELAFLQQLLIDDTILKIEYEADHIPYLDGDGLEHNYYPDFKVTYKSGNIIVYEVKASYAIDDPIVQLKSKAATLYYSKLGIEYKIISESDIDWDNYPNYNDKNILNDTNIVESPIKNEVPDAKLEIDLILHPEKIPIGLPTATFDHFMSKIYNGSYTYRNHPRTDLNKSYESLMNWINSEPKYSISIYDVYDWISRNALICRLRDEAPEDEKDIRRWMCKYLSEDSLPSSDNFDRVKLEYQLNGIRDFHLPTRDYIISKLKDLHRQVSIGDIINIVGYSRNKLLRYAINILKLDPYETCEKINSEIENSNSSI